MKLADRHGRKIAFVVLRESGNESRSIGGASAEHSWSIVGAYMEHTRSIYGGFGRGWHGHT